MHKTKKQEKQQRIPVFSGSFPPLVRAGHAPKEERRRLVGRARLHLVVKGLAAPAARAARVLGLLQARRGPCIGAVGPEDLGARAGAHRRPRDDGGRPRDPDGFLLFPLFCSASFVRSRRSPDDGRCVGARLADEGEAAGEGGLGAVVGGDWWWRERSFFFF